MENIFNEDTIEQAEVDTMVDAYFGYLLNYEQDFENVEENDEIVEIIKHLSIDDKVSALEYAYEDAYFCGVPGSFKNTVYLSHPEVYVQGANPENVGSPQDWVFNDEDGGYISFGYGVLINFDIEKLKEYVENLDDELEKRVKEKGLTDGKDTISCNLHEDWMSVETLENDEEKFWENISSIDENFRSYSPFEFFAKELNESSDPDYFWNLYEEYTRKGIAQAVKLHLGFELE